MDEKQKSYSEWLVLRCQQNDESALHPLLTMWQGRYLAYANYRLGERHAAQDAVQEALLAICRNLHRLSDPASFPRWSFTILERRCVDWQRKRVRERRVFTEQDGSADNWSEADPKDTGEATDASLDSERLLESLEPELRALVRLYYLEEFSIGDIAEVLQLAPGTVKSRLYYARKQMQQLLEKRR